MQTSGRTVVLGLGNPVRADDGVGLAVVRELARLLAQDPVPGVDVLAGTRGGFELIDLLRGYSRAIIVDCLTLPDPQPGNVRQLGLHAVAGSARLQNVHEISVGTAFRLAERMSIPMPADVVIYAVEAGDTYQIIEDLSPPVRAAVTPLAQEIHSRLQRSAPATEPCDDPDFQNRRVLYSPEMS